MQRACGFAGMLAIAAAGFTPAGLAHPGGVDRYGCHRDREASEYHCHRGVLDGRRFASKDQLREVLRAPPGGTPAPVTLCGRVQRVLDGDSLLLEHGGRRVELRLQGIDAPEHGQPYGEQAKRALQRLLGERVACAVLRDIDAYGRGVVRLHAGGTDVNAELVRRGAAWVYRRYVDDPTLERLEAEAQAAARGLWSLPARDRLPPWDWRRRHDRRGAR